MTTADKMNWENDENFNKWMSTTGVGHMQELAQGPRAEIAKLHQMVAMQQTKIEWIDKKLSQCRILVGVLTGYVVGSLITDFLKWLFS